MTPTRVVFLLSIVLLLIPSFSSADIVTDPVDMPNVRITEPWLRQLYQAGLAGSPTFRSLVERLEDSDVVVYLQTDPRALLGVAGRLTFLSMVAGTRYVVIRLSPLRSPAQQLAMIGHELQHAVEVAERPDIVDQESMLREYMRFGYLNGASASGVALDTKAATEVAWQITDELRDQPLVVAAPLLP
ncbi:MAG: hypothetical protein HYU37_15400 [Acidobacteria bacterium]|nr:hypothetical protein [Acidobacteriota bacterium]